LDYWLWCFFLIPLEDSAYDCCFGAGDGPVGGVLSGCVFTCICEAGGLCCVVCLVAGGSRLDFRVTQCMAWLVYLALEFGVRIRPLVQGLLVMGSVLGWDGGAGLGAVGGSGGPRSVFLTAEGG